MRSNIKKLYILTGMVVLLLPACRKEFFYGGINDNPQQISATQLAAAPGTLLNGAENTIGYTVGGDVSRFTSVFVQSVRGFNRQFAGYDNYTFSAQDFNTVWANLYEGGLNNLAILKNIADSKGYNYYSGISRVLTAYEFGLITDLWGDVPVFQALQGNNGIISPAYDQQQKIYPYLQSTLDSAIKYLSGAGGNILPGGDDEIYNGDAKKWTQFAYSLKARYYLHLSKVDPNYADNVLSVVDKGINSSANDANVPFYNSETSSNPWYQYIEQRSDIFVGPSGSSGGPGSYLVDQMTALNDPRLPVFVDLSNNVVNAQFAAINANVTLMSYTETLFIKAEALSAKNDPTAVTAYNAAVTESFLNAGLSAGAAATYLAANPLNGATHAARLPQIILQKYFALFTQPEPYNDWRRTGYPVLTPASGAAIPRRFIYTQNELDYNGANVPKGTTLFSKVWWDQ